MPTHTIRNPTNFAAHATWEKGPALITESLGPWAADLGSCNFASEGCATIKGSAQNVHTTMPKQIGGNGNCTWEINKKRYKVMFVVRSFENEGNCAQKGMRNSIERDNKKTFIEIAYKLFQNIPKPQLKNVHWGNWILRGTMDCQNYLFPKCLFRFIFR